MKLLYYLACIGNPQFETKLNILNQNVQVIYNDIKTKFDVIINLYETDSNYENSLLKMLSSHPYIDSVHIYTKKGVLTELFLTNTYNATINHYDYILFILDDVQLENIGIMAIAKIKQKYNLDIISPKIRKSTWSYMNTYNDCLTINNFLEVYCLLMSPDDMVKFLSLYTVENKWMWGVDHLFGYYNVNAGVIHTYSAIHMLPSKSSKGVASRLMNEYIRNKTRFRSFGDIHKSYKAIKEKIIL